MGLHAFIKILKKKQSNYRELLKSLKAKIQLPYFTTTARNLAAGNSTSVATLFNLLAVVEPSLSAVFDDIKY